MAPDATFLRAIPPSSLAEPCSRADNLPLGFEARAAHGSRHLGQLQLIIMKRTLPLALVLFAAPLLISGERRGTEIAFGVESGSTITKSFEFETESVLVEGGSRRCRTPG